MYQKLDLISNVSGEAVILAKDLLFGINNAVKFYKSNKSTEVSGGISHLMKVEDSVLVEFFEQEDGFERTFLFDANLTKVRKDFLDKKMIRDVLDATAVALSYDKDYNTIASVIDLRKYDEVWAGRVNPDGFALVNSEFVVFWDDHEIELINYQVAKTISKVKITDLEVLSTDETNRIHKVLGVYKGELLMLLEGGLIVRMNIESGSYSMLCHLRDASATEDLFWESIFLNAKEGKLECLNGRYYFEIDLTSCKLEIKKDFGEMKRGNWRISRSCPYDDVLTFTGSKDGISTFVNAFGIFDKEKLEVVWEDGVCLEHREKEGFFVNPPIMNEDLLTIKSSEGNLHIYEKMSPDE